MHTRLINTAILALPLVLILPLVFQYGVFFDGALYAAYARNLAEGVGSFWNAVSWPGATSPVRDQPPLAFFLESFFFKALGNRFYGEGLYGVVCLYFTFAGILRVQRVVLKSKSAHAWPVLLYLSIPIVLWATRNNMIENTLTVFTTWATFFGIAFAFAPTRGQAAAHAFAFSLALVAAFLTKGPVALFPLAVPFFARFIFHFSPQRKHILREITVSLLPVLLTAAAFAAFWLVPNFRDFTFAYFREQILPSSMGARESSGSHFTIVKALVNNGGIPVAITIALAFVTKTLSLRRKSFSTPTKPTVLYTLIFLSAWTPFLISTKQMPWYLIPSLPFLCLALSHAAQSSFHKLSTWLEPHKTALSVFIAAVIAVGVVLSVINYGRVYKNESFYNAFLPLENKLPTGTQYGVCDAALVRHWRMVTPLLRYFQSAVVHGTSPSGIWIVENNKATCFNTASCVLLNANANNVLPEPQYQIYNCAGARP